MRTGTTPADGDEPARATMTRRGMLGLALATTAAAMGLGGCSGDQQATPGRTGRLDFTDPLAIPPLAESTLDGNGVRHYSLTMRTGRTELLPGKPADTWGFNGSYLGPTLRAARGEQVEIHVTNELPEPSTVHWHGMELPAVVDGGPHQTIQPGSTWDPHWRIVQPAATLWYHPHPMGRTAQHVYRGLAGLFLLDDDEAPAGVPSRYGVDDIPLIVQDKIFNADGSLSEEASPTFGIMGQDILVNGTYNPVHRVSTGKVRFRILNASNARMYHIGFSDNRPMTIVGTDSGLLPEPIVADRVPLSPAERAEVVVEFAPGEEVILHSYGGSYDLDAGDFDLLKITAEPTLRPSPELPGRLASTPPVAAPPGARVRTFTLNGHDAINHQEMDMHRIDEIVPVGAHEIWEVENHVYAHNFHIHDAAFRVLEAEGDVPPAFRAGRKDTVFVAPKSRVRLAVEFGKYADPVHPYMYHCHILRHEDAGMMGQFVTVEPGTEDQARR